LGEFRGFKITKWKKNENKHQ